MRIGVLGGSFDPPHLAHQALAECAVQQLELDKLIVAVAFRQWQKQHDAAASDRLAMARLQFTSANIEVSDIDLRRETPTFTIDTISDLKSIYPDSEFIFITGADALAGLPSWHRAAELAETLKFAAAPRAGESVKAPEGFDVIELACELPEISSTEIRQTLESGDVKNSNLNNWLAPEVLSYIENQRLYQ